MGEKIYRLHYRGQLQDNVSMGQLQEATDQCVRLAEQAKGQGRILTAALYQADRMLFFYYEALGEPLPVAEPLSLEKEVFLPESGEDKQTTCIRPEELLVPLCPLLQIWPGQKGDRHWVYMYHIYYHSIPEDVESWNRDRKPKMRRGRIAFLREDKLFSYVYFHKAIVEEGLLMGDRYQSIALHENILFSYFEEPKTMVNVKNEPEGESRVIEDWMAADPESHFIHMPEGKGGNFMFLPALFAV